MPTTNTTSLTMTPRQAANFLGLGLTKTLQLIRDKRLKVWMLDNRIRVSTEACHEFLSSLPNGYQKGEPVYDNENAPKHVRKAAKRRARS